MSGTVFGAFYDVVRRIPAGSVSTYGQVARLAGMPRSARLVGYAMASCQDPTVPCHRVVDRFGGTKAAFDTFAPGTAGPAGGGGCGLSPGRHGGSGTVPLDTGIIKT